VTGQPEPRRSSFEDLSDLDAHVRSSAVPTGRRTAILITATVVLFAGALFAVLYVVLLVPFASSSGASISGGAIVFLITYGVAQVVAAVLVLLLLPAGRWFGILVGVIGIVLGLVRATSTPASGLVSILLSAFVIYALASSGPSFRRE
jgi:hypothetical protein